LYPNKFGQSDRVIFAWTGMMRQAVESKGTTKSHHIFLNNMYIWGKE
jgi:hypothetical protein